MFPGWKHNMGKGFGFLKQEGSVLGCKTLGELESFVHPFPKSVSLWINGERFISEVALLVTSMALSRSANS